MILVISSSLNSDSRSRVLADAACAYLENLEEEFEFIDLQELKLPFCDGDQCYGNEEVQRISATIAEAHGILVATPIYNYDVNSSIKNVVELTGKAWTEKVVGFLCAAGGQGSYMAPMGLANSLMLDFRSLILPRFIYATSDVFQGNEISDLDLQERLEQLVDQMVRVCNALN